MESRPSKTYMDLNNKYLKEAQALLDKKDYPQASEKLWGAAAEIVKAVASKKGKELRTHSDLFDFVNALDRDHPDLKLNEEFLIANGLHQNFYEAWLPAEVVERGAEIVRSFVEKMKDFL